MSQVLPAAKVPEPHRKPKNPASAPLVVHDAKGRKQYPYGNYSRYYGYRNTQRFSDGRLEALPADLLRGKACLDIGCNSGEFTIAAGIGMYIYPLLTAPAEKLHPRSMVGVDIDPSLIDRARRNLEFYHALHPAEPTADQPTGAFPISFPICLGPLPVLDRSVFPGNVSFRAENFCQTPECPVEAFDVVFW